MLRFLQFFFFLNITVLYFSCHIDKTGQNWRTINANKANHLYGVHFFDKKHGWAVGSDNLILKTDDGGLTWVEISKPNALFSDPIKKVHFSTQNHGWIIGLRGKILYTTNGGKSWVKQNSTRDKITIEVSTVVLKRFPKIPSDEVYEIEQLRRDI